MPKKGKNVKTSGSAAERADVPEEPTASPPGDGAGVDEAGPVAAGTDQPTFGAASGRSFAIAREDYPDASELNELPGGGAALANEIVTALEGDLLELLAMQQEWGYGRRFKEREGAINEGTFRLEWVHGVKLVLEGVKRIPVEVDILSPEYGFREAKLVDAAAKLRSKRYRKKIEDAAKLWAAAEAAADVQDALRKEESAAAKVAAALEREDLAEEARRQKAEEKRERLRKEAERKAEEAEAARRAAAEKELAERRAAEEQEARRRAVAAEVARRRALEAEEERRKAIEVEIARRRAEQAEVEERRRQAEEAVLQQAPDGALEQRQEPPEPEQVPTAEVEEVRLWRIRAEEAERALRQAAEEVSRWRHEAEEAKAARREAEEDAKRCAEEAAEARRAAAEAEETKRLVLEATGYQWYEGQLVRGSSDAQEAERRAVDGEDEQGDSDEDLEEADVSTPASPERPSDGTEVAEAGPKLETARRPFLARRAFNEWRVSAGSREKATKSASQAAVFALSVCVGSPPNANHARKQRASIASARKAQWDQQAANLERFYSESSSGAEVNGEDFRDGRCRRQAGQKKTKTGKVSKHVSEEKRSGELHAIAEEWEKAHSELASKASDLSLLNKKVKRNLMDAREPGDLECIAEEMATQAERKAEEVRELKERVFRAMMHMKRSKGLKNTTNDMDDAQKELEKKAQQLRESLMKRAWQGMLESKRSRELEIIADEMAEQLQIKANSIKNKIRKGLLRAHRAGELIEMREELDEMADSVSNLSDSAPGLQASRTPVVQREDGVHPSAAGISSAAVDEGRRVAARVFAASRKRWAEYSSSESDTPQMPLGLWPATTPHPFGAAGADASGSNDAHRLRAAAGKEPDKVRSGCVGDEPP